MFKNRKLREEFIADSNNWINLGDVAGIVRVQRLKGTYIYKIERLFSNDFVPKKWVQYGHCLKFNNDKGTFTKEVCKTELIEYIQSLQEWDIDGEVEFK